MNPRKPHKRCSLSGTITLYGPDGRYRTHRRYGHPSDRRRILAGWAESYAKDCFPLFSYGITPDIDDDALRGIVLEPVVEEWEEGVEVLVAGVPAY